MAANAAEEIVRRRSDAVDVDFQVGGQDSSVPVGVAVTTDHLPTQADVEPDCEVSLESTPARSTPQENNHVNFVSTTGQAVCESPLHPNPAPAQADTSDAEQGAVFSEPVSWTPTYPVNLDDLAQPLDASAFENGDFDTFVAIPYEPTTKLERRNDQLPRKPTSATRPFILRRFTEAQKRATLSQTPETNGFTARYDYLKKYPEDPPEEAMGPNARVWRVYLDEAEQFDIDIVDGFRDTVDLMLVFAGLFSAVVTTFVVQAATALQPDYNQVIASVLIELLHIQRAISNGLPTPDPLPTTLNLESTTTTGFDRWANGLWFVSLSFSLATALFAVLVKQWIQSYVSPVSGDPQTRVRVRQYRFIGLEKWHVPLIVGLLPTLLHLSLLLFFLGLVVFLFALDHAIAAVIASIATVIYLIYAVANLAPLFDTQCPYKTPLSTYAFLLLHSYIPGICALSRSVIHLAQTMTNPIKFINRHTSRTWEAIQAPMRRLRRKARWFRCPLVIRLQKVYKQCTRYLHRSSSKPMPMLDMDFVCLPKQETRIPGSMKFCELEDIRAQGDSTDAEALCWVVTWSSNLSVRTVVAEAAGDLRIGYEERAKAILRDGGVADAACASLQMCTKRDWQNWRMEVQPGLEHCHLRAVLAHFQLGQYMPAGSEFSGAHLSTRLYCPCIRSLVLNPHRDVDVDETLVVSGYFSLLQKPSWELVRPQHILQSLPPNLPKFASLLSLRRAALHIRTRHFQTDDLRYPDDMVDWPSCQKLFAFVQLEPQPPRDDLFSLWQTTLVSVYLASLVSEVLNPGDPGLLGKLLFNHIKLGSPELSRDLAIKLSVESCIELLVHTPKNSTAYTDFSSESDEGSQIIKQLSTYFRSNQLWVSDPDKTVIGPHHTLLVAFLDHSKKPSALIPLEHRGLIYRLGYNLMLRDEPRSSDPELDLVPLLSRLLRAALIQSQLPEPFGLLISQILCLSTVLCDSPPDGLPILLDVFRQDDGISVLEKIIQRAGSELAPFYRGSIMQALTIYLSQVFPVEETSLPSCKPGISPQSHKGLPGEVDSLDHVDYILQHLEQIVWICVACHNYRISHPDLDTSHPDTSHSDLDTSHSDLDILHSDFDTSHSDFDYHPPILDILRRIVQTQFEALPESYRAFAALETQWKSIPLYQIDGYWTFKQNLKAIIAILRSDLEAARSPVVQDPLQPEPPLPQSSISEAIEIRPDPSLDLGTPAAEEVDLSPTHAESFISRSAHRLKTAVWRVIAARRRDALIPLHTRTPLQLVRESESAIDDVAVQGSSIAHRDEEDGLPATGTSAT